jgi:hypothetical protein
MSVLMLLILAVVVGIPVVGLMIWLIVGTGGGKGE